MSAALCAADGIGLAVHPRSLETGHRMTMGETTSADATAMRRALDLATRGPARGVNPRVGCVILSPDGEVLAEGWHRGAGTAHAEVGTRP